MELLKERKKKKRQAHFVCLFLAVYFVFNKKKVFIVHYLSKQILHFRFTKQEEAFTVSFIITNICTVVDALYMFKYLSTV